MQVVPNCGEVPFSFFRHHLNLGVKSEPKVEDLEFFLNLEQNVHQIAAAVRKRLVTAAKASLHEIFYSLNAVYQCRWERFRLIKANSKQRVFEYFSHSDTNLTLRPTPKYIYNVVSGRLRGSQNNFHCASL